MSPLRKRMIREMQLRNFPETTQVTYLRTMARFALHFHRSPDKITMPEIKDYLLYLRNERHLQWSSINGYAAAIRFFFVQTLYRPEKEWTLPPRKVPRRLPEILSKEELERLFESTENLKHCTLLITAYASGLRVSDLVSLKVTDIDSSRMMIRVEQGKRQKDRYTILSKRLLLQLRSYWKIYRPQDHLFPGRFPGRPYTTRNVQYVYKRACRKAGIKKKGGTHNLRHAFATHLLEAGIDIRTIQILMGHGSIRTTIGYIQVARKKLEGTPSLLDQLKIPEPERFK